MYFTSALSDVTAIIGTDAELVCRLSNEECDGVWYKEGIEVRKTKLTCVKSTLSKNTNAFGKRMCAFRSQRQTIFAL